MQTAGAAAGPTKWHSKGRGPTAHRHAAPASPGLQLLWGEAELLQGVDVRDRDGGRQGVLVVVDMPGPATGGQGRGAGWPTEGGTAQRRITTRQVVGRRGTDPGLPSCASYDFLRPSLPCRDPISRMALAELATANSSILALASVMPV